MSVHLDAMLYTDNGKTYRLFPVCIWKGLRPYVLEARVYAETGEFLDTWPRATMPLKLINQLQHHHAYIRSFRPDALGPDEIAGGSDL